jgi:hypothetical protein
MAAGTRGRTPGAAVLVIGMTQPQPHQRPQLPPLPPRPQPASIGRRLVVATGVLQLTVGICAGLALGQVAMFAAIAFCPQRQVSAPTPQPRPRQSTPFAVMP